MPTDPPEKQNTYLIDAESGAEMARLMNQQRLLEQEFGELFPGSIAINRVKDVLDIGCGPGGWALDMAFAYPKINFTGIDISKNVIDYANAQAFTRGMNNATYRVMDATKPLAFSDNSFDFVNGRLLLGFMSPAAWPRLMRECWRITRPGGYICMTECEAGQSNSVAFETMMRLSARALFRAGQSFSPDGYHVGIIPMLGKLVQDAGFQSIQTTAHAVDFSAGTRGYDGFYDDMQALLHLIQPFLLKMEVTTKEEVEELYQQALADILSPDFRTVWFYLSVTGQKADDANEMRPLEH